MLVSQGLLPLSSQRAISFETALSALDLLILTNAYPDLYLHFPTDEVSISSFLVLLSPASSDTESPISQRDLHTQVTICETVLTSNANGTISGLPVLYKFPTL